MAKTFNSVFSGFKGMDQRAGCSVDMNALPELVNFFVDDNGALRKRPGITTLHKFSSEINTMWYGYLDGVDTVLIASGVRIYKQVDGALTFLGNTSGEIAQFVKFKDKVYCIGCNNLYVIDNSGLSIAEVYIPIVATGLSPSGDGTVYESPNVLTHQRRAQFCPDGTSTVFKLPEKNILSVDKVTINKATVNSERYSVDTTSGTVTFNIAPVKGLNSVEITYGTVEGYTFNSFLLCKHGVVFNDRLFLYGEPEGGSKLYHSSLADGIPDCTYFAESDYHVFNDRITGLTPCFNRLLIFFENSAKFTYAELFTDALGNTRTSFPVFELNSSKGTIQEGACVLMQNTPVTFCNDGLNRWVSTYIADERSAEPFSQRMYRFFGNIVSNEFPVCICNRKNASELWVASIGGIAIYNYQRDCFYLYYENDVTGLCEAGENMLIARKDGTLAQLTADAKFDDGKPIFGSISFPFCTFGTPFLLKSLSELTLDINGAKAFEANIMLDRGNRTFTETVHFSIDAAIGAQLRQIRRRCPLKRFYSCHAVLETFAEDACINAIGFIGNYMDGGNRIN